MRLPLGFAVDVFASSGALLVLRVHRPIVLHHLVLGRLGLEWITIEAGVAQPGTQPLVIGSGFLPAESFTIEHPLEFYGAPAELGALYELRLWNHDTIRHTVRGALELECEGFRRGERFPVDLSEGDMPGGAS